MESKRASRRSLHSSILYQKHSVPKPCSRYKLLELDEMRTDEMYRTIMLVVVLHRSFEAALRSLIGTASRPSSTQSMLALSQATGRVAMSMWVANEGARKKPSTMPGLELKLLSAWRWQGLGLRGGSCCKVRTPYDFIWARQGFEKDVPVTSREEGAGQHKATSPSRPTVTVAAAVLASGSQQRAQAYLTHHTKAAPVRGLSTAKKHKGVTLALRLANSFRPVKRSSCLHASTTRGPRYWNIARTSCRQKSKIPPQYLPRRHACATQMRTWPLRSGVPFRCAIGSVSCFGRGMCASGPEPRPT